MELFDSLKYTRRRSQTLSVATISDEDINDVEYLQSKSLSVATITDTEDEGHVHGAKELSPIRPVNPKLAVNEDLSIYPRCFENDAFTPAPGSQLIEESAEDVGLDVEDSSTSVEAGSSGLMPVTKLKPSKSSSTIAPRMNILNIGNFSMYQENRPKTSLLVN